MFTLLVRQTDGHWYMAKYDMNLQVLLDYIGESDNYIILSVSGHTVMGPNLGSPIIKK